MRTASLQYSQFYKGKQRNEGGREIYTAHIHQMAKLTPCRGCVNSVVPQFHNSRSNKNMPRFPIKH